MTPRRGSTGLLLVCIAGIYACYVYYGYLQEKIFRHEHDGEKFNYSLFMLLAQCVMSGLVARAAMLCRETSVTVSSTV